MADWHERNDEPRWRRIKDEAARYEDDRSYADRYSLRPIRRRYPGDWERRPPGRRRAESRPDWEGGGEAFDRGYAYELRGEESRVTNLEDFGRRRPPQEGPEDWGPDWERWEGRRGSQGRRQGIQSPRTGSFIATPRYRQEPGFDRPYTRDTNLEAFGQRTPYRQNWRVDESQWDRERLREEKEQRYRRGSRERARPDRERESGWRNRIQGPAGQEVERGFRYDWEGEPYSPTFTYTEFWSAEGPFKGVGPRGYQPSDERIHEAVCERLTEHGQIDAREIEVDVEAGEVSLRGAVPRRRDKWLAEDLAESVSAVKQVNNSLRVSRER